MPSLFIMTPETLFVFGLLAAVVLFFVTNLWRPDIVALLVVPALMLSGILRADEALAGFSDQAVVLIAALFVVGEGLVQTGIAYRVGAWLTKTAHANETWLLVLLMLAVAALGSVMSSTGVVAIFVPIVLNICSRLKMEPKQLMMPLAFAALFSGMLTLIATPPNLMVNDALRNAGLQPFGFFAITPIGILSLTVGIFYLWSLGRRLLPPSAQKKASLSRRQSLVELIENYQLQGQFQRLRVSRESPLAEQTLAETQLRTRWGFTVVGISRRTRFGETAFPAEPHSRIQALDSLYVAGPKEAIADFCEAEHLDPLPIQGPQQHNLMRELGLVEILLPPESRLIGRTLRQIDLRDKQGLTVLGIRRHLKPLHSNLHQEKLAFGDLLLATGSWKRIGLLQSEPKNFLILNLPEELAEVSPSYRQAPFAMAILVAMVIMMVFGLVANVAAALMAALAMGLCRCLRVEDAYRSINWPSLVLIAGMLPLARAMEKTGGVAMISEALVAVLGGAGPLALLAGIFIMSAVIGMFISNTATAVLMAPISISAAQMVSASPYPFAMTVAVASSAAFLTPISSPVNTLVMTPGGYSFNDFLRVGTPLLVVIMALTLVVVPLLFPF